jgi:hypothetical protein
MIRAALSTAIAVLALGAVGCGGSGEGAPEIADFDASSTNPLSGQLGTGDDGDAPSPLVGDDPEVIQARFDQALASEDFCQLAEALDSSLPDVSDGDAVVAVYAKVSTSVETAVVFVPADLAEAWEAVVKAARLASVAAERSGGDIDDPALNAPFTTNSFETSFAKIDRYVEENCT